MTLIAPAANALNKGMGIPPLFKTDKSALGITSWVNGPGFLYPDLYGDTSNTASPATNLPG
ncbi:hypothetical protein [Streptomyces violascens]|uniref:hypothetical protein n=1 Tax=Streptomyces violascens TaxID=67381 RepID=UPI003691AB72